MAKHTGFGGFPGGGMNVQNMMAQAQKMQAQMQKVQEEAEQSEIEVSAGGGMVTVVVSGKRMLKSIHISPEIVDPDDIESLEDVVLAAVNEAMKKAEEMVSESMAKVTGGLNLPGMF